jgi:pimeloyl-[acyl-carrier protein] methyl ester esterase
LGERLCGIVVTGVTPKFVCSDDWLHGLALRDVEGLAVAYRRNSRKARDSFAARMFSEQERKNHDLMSFCAAIFAEIPVPSPHVALQGLEILVNSDIRPLLPAITLPLLVIYGDSDAICLPAAARMVVETVADGKLVEFNGCGHVPFLARPETWNEVAGCFFRGICAKSHR